MTPMDMNYYPGLNPFSLVSFPLSKLEDNELAGKMLDEKKKKNDLLMQQEIEKRILSIRDIANKLPISE